MKRNLEDLNIRLNKVEGQIRGVKQMLDEDRDCEDIIIQLSAVNSAVTNIAKIIMTSHIEHCILDGIKNGDEVETIKNFKKVIEQFVKFK